MTQPKKSLPENAKLVYQGELFKVYQWEQELYDGTTKTFERIRRPDTASVLAVVKGKIVILDQEQPHRDPFIALPGGRVEEGEDMLVAAKRELLEETGYASDDVVLWKFYGESGTILFNQGLYIARNCYKVHDGEPDNGEKIKVRFIDFDELLMLSEDANLRNGNNFRELMYRLRLHQGEREELKKLLGLNN